MISKNLYLAVIALLIVTGVHAQETAKFDSTNLKVSKILFKYFHPRAASKDNPVQDTVVVQFKIDSNKKITDASILRSLDPEHDAEVLNIFKTCDQTIPLNPAEYTVAVRFVVRNGKPSDSPKLLDQKLYKNFLFEITALTKFTD